MSHLPQLLLSELAGFFDLSIDRQTLISRILEVATDFSGIEKIAIYLPDSESPGPSPVNQVPQLVKPEAEQLNVFSIPLQSPKGRVLGVFQIQNWNGGLEQKDALSFLELLAQFAALAFEYRLETPVGSANPKVADVISLDLRRAKEHLERGLIDRALLQTRGNKSQAAKLLGITREGLRKAMKKSA